MEATFCSKRWPRFSKIFQFLSQSLDLQIADAVEDPHLCDVHVHLDF